MPLIQLLALRNINGRDEPLLAKDYNISNTLEEELKMIQKRREKPMRKERYWFFKPLDHSKFSDLLSSKYDKMS